MTKKAIIIGSHPIADSLKRQYDEQGCDVAVHPQTSVDGINADDYDELCLLSDGNDHRAISLLSPLALSYCPDHHDGKRLLCHIMLTTDSALQTLQTCDLNQSVRQKIDVYPFTINELWSRSVVVDYEPITLQSERRCHVVIIGMGSIAEMVARQIALVAHFPNYLRDHSLRTRITMIHPDAEELHKDIVSHYPHLFDNSYYRLVKSSQQPAVAMLHRPMYEGQREDFVDVEWEFVAAEATDAEVRQKLAQWATDDRQLLSIVVAHDDHCQNEACAMLLPDELSKQNVPVKVYDSRLPHYDVTMPLVRMAKNVNYIYTQCYNDNVANWTGHLRYAVEIDPEERDRLWADLPNVKRTSSISNAMTIAPKMRSVGLDETDWDMFYDIPQQDIEILSQVEHNRWSVEELILGYCPCTADELQEIAADVANLKDAYKKRKIHYDLVAYSELQPDKTGRGVEIYDQCISACLPLIAKAATESPTR